MRGRWLKPEFMKDRKIAQLGLAAAIVYQTLWCMADDGGVARGAAEEIKGEMLVWWEELDVPTIRSSLAKLESAGRISGYEVGDDQYWTLHTLLKHQGKIHKPSRFRHPRPQDSGTTPAPVTEDEGTARNLDTSVLQHFGTSTPTAVEVREVSMSGVLITHLNRGMMDNPAIGEAMNPIPHGHGASVAAAWEIEQSGVPQYFASEFVYEAAKRYKPAGRNRQIRSLGYFQAGCIEAWEKQKARDTANETRPRLRPTDKASRSVAAIGDWLRDQETTDAEVIASGE
jgi:hypothetical protein